VNRDVSFEEEVAFRRSRESHREIDSEKREEMISSSPHPSTIKRDLVEPIETVDLVDPFDLVYLVDVPRDIVVDQKMPAWACQNLQQEEGHTVPRGTFRESKRPERFLSYVAAMKHISDSKPSCYEEASSE
jgi:hypothetical protein